jgi:hypothetical protein
MRRALPLALVACALAACAAVEGLDSLEKVDALPSGDDGGVTPNDGGNPIGSFCAAQGHTLFCDDFDEHPLPGPWETFHENGGTLTLDDAASASPPRSLLELASPLDAGPIDLGLRTAPLAMPSLPATIRFELAFLPAAVDPTANAAILLASLDFDDAAQNRYSLILTLFPVNDVLTLSLGEQSGLADGAAPYVPHTVPNPIALGAWTRIALAVTYTDSSTATAQLSLDGTPQFATPIALQPTVADASQVLAGIGSTYETIPSAGWTLRYDDVVLASP